MATQPKKGGIKTAADARKLSGEIADQSVDFGKPSFVTQNPRGEPRDLLRNFHFNYPFFPIVPAPRLAQTFQLDDSDQVSVTLPDGTIWVSFSQRVGDDLIVSFDGLAPSPATLTPQVPTPGCIINPPNNIAYMVYPSRSISLRGNGMISVTPYIATDSANVKNQ